MLSTNDKEINRIAVLFKAIGNELRLKIIFAILSKRKLTVNEIVEYCDSEQSLVSHNLKMLYRLGIVERKKIGREVYYLIVKEMRPIIRKLLKDASQALDIL